uniref:Uncharacterized protein n=1 Tax=viral metagenome TaxID=1070528 RepID=A0A6C0BQS1_9ZZZZ
MGYVRLLSKILRKYESIWSTYSDWEHVEIIEHLINVCTALMPELHKELMAMQKAQTLTRFQTVIVEKLRMMFSDTRKVPRQYRIKKVVPLWMLTLSYGQRRYCCIVSPATVKVCQNLVQGRHLYCTFHRNRLGKLKSQLREYLFVAEVAELCMAYAVLGYTNSLHN